MLKAIIKGAAAGAAGTTALNAVTYLDMAVRGRPTSDTPERTAGKLADEAGVRIPGDEQTRQNRLGGLGPLLGVGAGLGVGAVHGVVRTLGVRWPALVESIAIGVGAMVATDAPMIALGITDPKQWKAADYLADLVPHLVYGAVTFFTLEAMDQ